MPSPTEPIIRYANPEALPNVRNRKALKLFLGQRALKVDFLAKRNQVKSESIRRNCKKHENRIHQRKLTIGEGHKLGERST